MASKESDIETVKKVLEDERKASEKNKMSNLTNRKDLTGSRLERLSAKFKKLNPNDKIAKEVVNEKNLNEVKKEDKSNNKKIEENSKNKLHSKGGNLYSLKEVSAKGLEIQTLKKLKASRKKKDKKKKEGIASTYSKVSSQFFSNLSRKLLTKDTFKRMENELIKANLDSTPVGYLSMGLMTTALSSIGAIFIFLFFLFFNFEATLPIITRATEDISLRFFKVFWIIFVVPLGTFLLVYIFPSLEKKSAEFSIDNELPFATIHMSAISGSMINPIKIFEIIILTKEYPALEKEFKKMINEINLYGYDLVSALKNTAKNSPSKQLAELLNGLVTTINSGGDLPKFFEKRSESLLFDYKIEQQKASKAAETFMDIYISLVIAAPMILMLLMMIMKISGLGIAMGVMTIALIIILGVTVVNIIFLTFLQLKRNK